jgi:hypothetical protein
VLLFLLQTLSLRLVDSVATVGYVTELGVRHLPWVWLADLLLTLGAGTLYFRVADRWSRALLVRRLFLLSASGYLLCGLLLWLGCSPAGCYAFAYVWSAQQVAVLPMALWTLATDLHEARDQARLFPRLAAGESVGHLIGYASTACVGSWFGASRAVDLGLLLAAAGLCCAAAGCVRAVCGPPTSSSAALASDADSGDSHAQGARAALRLRPMMLSVMFGWIAMSVIVFHVMASLEGAAFATPTRLRTLYGAYNFGLTLVTLGAQWVAGRFLSRQRLEAAFVPLPAVMAIGSLVVLPWPGLSSAFALSAAMYLVHDAWDLPARHAWLGRVPAAARGRTTALLDNHAFVVGSSLAAIVLGLLCWHAPLAVTRAPFYLTFGALGALGSLLAAREVARPAPSARARSAVLGYVRSAVEAPHAAQSSRRTYEA